LRGYEAAAEPTRREAAFEPRKTRKARTCGLPAREMIQFVFFVVEQESAADASLRALPLPSAEMFASR